MKRKLSRYFHEIIIIKAGSLIEYSDEGNCNIYRYGILEQDLQVKVDVSSFAIDDQGISKIDALELYREKL